MYHCFAIPVPSVPNIIDQPADRPTRNRVRKIKENSEERDRNGHHNRCRDHILARWPVYLPHLYAHVVKKRSQPLPVAAHLPNRLHQRESAYSVGLFFSVGAYRVGHFAENPRSSCCPLHCPPF